MRAIAPSTLAATVCALQNHFWAVQSRFISPHTLAQWFRRLFGNVHVAEHFIERSYQAPNSLENAAVYLYLLIRATFFGWFAPGRV